MHNTYLLAGPRNINSGAEMFSLGLAIVLYTLRDLYLLLQFVFVPERPRLDDGLLRQFLDSDRDVCRDGQKTNLQQELDWNQKKNQERNQELDQLRESAQEWKREIHRHQETAIGVCGSNSRIKKRCLPDRV